MHFYNFYFISVIILQTSTIDDKWADVNGRTVDEKDADLIGRIDFGPLPLERLDLQ